MKKINLFLCLISVLFFGISCENNGNNGESSGNAKDLVKNVGKYHNEGLDWIFAKLSSSNLNGDHFRSSDNEVSTLEITELSYEYVQSIPEYAEIPYNPDINETAAKLDEVRDNFSVVGVQNSWTTITDDSSFKNSVSPLEQNAIAEVDQIFVYLSTSNLTTEQQLEYLKNSAFAIQSKYANTLIDNFQGEVLSGVLKILDSSSDYWYSNSISVTTPVDPAVPVNPTIVQADCLGYIFGWITAFWKDQSKYPTQSEFSAHTGDRIKEGLHDGLIASSFGMLK